MKCEAVYVCCREDEFDIAQEVFDRIWKTSNKPTYNEKKIKKKLQSVIDSHDTKHPDLQAGTYKEFVDLALKLLFIFVNKIFPAEPFLIQAAKTVLEKEQKAQRQNHTPGKRVQSNTSIRQDTQKGHETCNQRSPIKTRSRHISKNVNNNSTAEEQSAQSEGEQEESFHSTKSVPHSQGSAGARTRSGISRFSHRKAAGCDGNQTVTKQSGTSPEPKGRKRSRKLPSTDTDLSSESLILSSPYRPPVPGQPAFKVERSSPDEDSPMHTSTPSPSKQANNANHRQIHSDSDSETELDDKDGIRKYKYRKNIGRANRHNQSKRGRGSKKGVYDFIVTSESDSEGVDDLDKSLIDRIGGEKPKKIQMRKSLEAFAKHQSPSKGSGRKKWTDDEEERLYEAIVQFGPGNWAAIKEAYGFVGRTQVHLKDKWRTILKQGRHKVLMSKYGRVGGIEYF